jgi:hypothetical protein
VAAGPTVQLAALMPLTQAAADPAWRKAEAPRIAAIAIAEVCASRRVPAMLARKPFSHSCMILIPRL